MGMRLILLHMDYAHANTGGSNSAVLGCSLAQSQERTPVEELCNSHQCTCFLLLSPIREVFKLRLPSLHVCQQFSRCPKRMCIHRVKSLCKKFVHILVIKYNVMTA